jgi:hypothetical protein
MKRPQITVAASLALAVTLLFTAAAQAAPALSVTLTRAPATINRGDEFVSYAVKVKNTSGEATSGPLGVAIELPTGLKLAAASGSGWSCTLATLTCTSSAIVAGGASYPTLSLSQVWIDPSAPDTVTAKATASGGGAAASATAEDSFSFGPAESFGLGLTSARAEDEAGAEMTQAGGHPFAASATFKTKLRSNPEGWHLPVEDLHAGVSEIPAGVVGNPSAAEAFCTFTVMLENNCSDEAAVGGVFLDLQAPEETGGLEMNVPVYRLPHEAGYPASFGFRTPGTSYVVRTRVRSDGDYGITAVIPLVPSTPRLFESVFTFCGYGAKLFHGPGATQFERCKKLTEPVHNRKAFVTLGTDCAAGQPLTRFGVDSWLHRGAYQPNGLPDLTDSNWTTLDFLSPALTGCERLTEEWVDQKAPSFGFQPDSHAADTPAAYTAHVHVPQDGLEDPNGLGTSHLKNTVVTLPQGIGFNPGIGDGLAACSEEQIGLLGTNFPAPSHVRFDSLLPECPPNSKVGLATIETPLLEETLHGSVYLASQRDNPFDSDYAIYLTVEEPEVGVIFKLAGKVVPDPVTGQITTVFKDNPQLPFNDLDLKFFGGGRAALANPVTCGSFAVETEMTPWSALDPEHPLPSEIAHPFDQIQIDSGPGGSPCVTNPARRPFDLGLAAGAKDPLAGAASPFSLRITRPDGSQELDRLEISPPPGFTASLKGIPYCAESQIANAQAGRGRAEQDSPSCPSASQVGSVEAGAGAGPTPFYAPGKLYLAGPYKGAPLSVVAITPAVAGPFDLGNVVIRSALQVDPTTARITAITDPIPQIVKGIPLRIRDIRIDLDRPDWALNPTNCEAMSVDVTAFGSNGAVAHPSSRFQVGGCEGLGFGPKLTGFLKGSTKRGGNPAFTSTLTYPKGAYANVAQAAVTLPHSAFLDQSHIRTICTRVQFAADACPQGAVYGSAEATTPLLDAPLTGDVYLRSSSNKLPDLVVALRGPAAQPIEIDLAGRVDSINGGIRTTFDVVPDAPVSKFTLHMQGGDRGLLVNSRDLCGGKPQRMTVRLLGQNGKRADQAPKLGKQCGKRTKKKSSKHGRSRGRLGAR